MRGMILLGPAGAGKTTLGQYVAHTMHLAFLDIDEYIWQNDTEIPYTVMYPKKEKIERLTAAVRKAQEFVMAGSMNSFHEHFDQLLLLAVYLTADAALRVKRVDDRARREFGERILPGGDMYDSHQQFLKETAAYDADAASCNSRQHALWLAQLTCPILRLDGGDPLQKNAKIIVDTYRKLQAGR